MTRSSVPGFLIALAVLATGFAVAFLVGRFPVSVADIAAVVWSKLAGVPSGVSPAVESVILQVRGPRVIAAFLVGAALAIAGTAFQGLFRNPLVSPDILGASSGAALGAVLGIYFSLGVIAIQGFAFHRRADRGRRRLSDRLGDPLARSDPGAGADRRRDRLAARRRRRAREISRRSLQPASGHDLLAARQSRRRRASPICCRLPVPIALGAIVLLLLRFRMNVMSLSEEEARALGVPTTALRIAIVAAATLVTSASVATAGIIGWVGLVVPHLARSLVGPDFAKLLPVAGLLGGGFLLFIDTIARTGAAIEIPLGILTAVVGTPFFIWLLASVSKTWS